jgi:hypothetical protein
MVDSTPTPQHTAIRHEARDESSVGDLAPLLGTLRQLIADARFRALRAVDEIQAFPIWDAVRSELSWTHHRLLTRVDKAQARQWYMNEAAEQNWSSRAFVRDPVMLEFLGLPGSGKLLESSLEQGLMDKLQAFLLELGKGFAFVARQHREQGLLHRLLPSEEALRAELARDAEEIRLAMNLKEQERA